MLLLLSGLYILGNNIIYASQYAPNIFLIKALDDTPYTATTSFSFSGGYATQAFDRNGKKVPFLQQYGKEDFLLRFIDPSLGPDNLESAGQGHISGKYHFKQYRFVYAKNIYHHLFFQAIMAIQDLSINDISAEFIDSEIPLSQDQINYLHKLNNSIPSTIQQSGMNTTNFHMGFHKTLKIFNHIEYLRTLLSLGISTPQSMSNDNRSVLQFPCAANIHFGYPAIGAIDIGVRDWFSCTLCGIVIPFQPTTKIIPINRTSENNHLLFSQSTQATIYQKPFFAGTIYAEFKGKQSKYISLIGYSYSQYLQSRIKPTNTTLFPEAHANRSIVLDGFSLGSLLIECIINKSSDSKKLSPIISFFFSIPVAGILYQQTLLLGGSCNFQINYEF